MDALVIGPQQGLAAAVARALRRRGRAVLQGIAADVAGAERIGWLLEEAGRPELIVVVDSAPYATAHELLAATDAQVVLVAERRAAMTRAGSVARRSYVPREAPGLTVVPLGRAGRRWFHLTGRPEPMSAERAAAVVLRACGTAAVPAS